MLLAFSLYVGTVYLSIKLISVFNAFELTLFNVNDVPLYVGLLITLLKSNCKSAIEYVEYVEAINEVA